MEITPEAPIGADKLQQLLEDEIEVDYANNDIVNHNHDDHLTNHHVNKTPTAEVEINIDMSVDNVENDNMNQYDKDEQEITNDQSSVNKVAQQKDIKDKKDVKKEKSRMRRDQTRNYSEKEES